MQEISKDSVSDGINESANQYEEPIDIQLDYNLQLFEANIDDYHEPSLDNLIAVNQVENYDEMIVHQQPIIKKGNEKDKMG